MRSHTHTSHAVSLIHMYADIDFYITSCLFIHEIEADVCSSNEKPYAYVICLLLRVQHFEMSFFSSCRIIMVCCEFVYEFGCAVTAKTAANPTQCTMYNVHVEWSTYQKRTWIKQFALSKIWLNWIICNINIHLFSVFCWALHFPCSHFSFIYTSWLAFNTTQLTNACTLYGHIIISYGWESWTKKCWFKIWNSTLTLFSFSVSAENGKKLFSQMVRAFYLHCGTKVYLILLELGTETSLPYLLTLFCKL